MRRIGRHVGLAIGLAGLVFVIRELVRSWDDVAQAVSGADLVPVAAALALGSVGMVVLGLGWHKCLTALGAPRSVVDTLYRYFVGELGKYVPGGIWAVLGRGEMARRGGVAGGVAYGSTVMSLATTYLAAILLIASLSLGAGAMRGQGSAWLAVLALLPLGVLALHPRVVGAVLGVARRISGRDLRIGVPTWGISLSLLAWHVPAWLAIGGATWLTASALDPLSPDLRNVLFATALSWVVGLLVVPAPGGIGVREGVFVAAATSLSSSGVAAAVAITARLIFVLVDLIGAAATTILTRGSSLNPPPDRLQRGGERPT